jgi:hypothetical protein
MTSRAQFERQVEQRADYRCEYCRMHQSLQGAKFHLEHVIPKSLGGPTSLNNLAWACPGCNLHKAARTQSIDPATDQLVSLFNPRLHAWGEHFQWDEYHIAPLTDIGRATVAALDLNHERRIKIRQAEKIFSLFPPDAE